MRKTVGRRAWRQEMVRFFWRLDWTSVQEDGVKSTICKKLGATTSNDGLIQERDEMENRVKEDV